MNKPPKLVTFIGWLFITVGIIGFAYHVSDCSLDSELGWMVYQVILSAFHSPVEFAIHLLLTLGIAYVLLRPDASQYSRNVQPHTEHPTG